MTNNWNDMACSEFTKRKDDIEIAFLPIGAIEVHGPHDPMGADNIHGPYFANILAEKYNGIALPVIPYGMSRFLNGFPGTMYVSYNSLYNYTKDVIESIIRNGIKKIFILQGHLTNLYVLDEVIYTLKDIYPDVQFAQVDIWRFMKNNSFDVVEDEYSSKFGHDGEVCTSVMLALRGDLVLEREDRANPLINIKSNNPDIKVYQEFNEISEFGAIGNPYKASKEKGEILIERFIKTVSEFIESWES